MFNVGQEIVRSNLHDLYGGQRQGGISTPVGHPVIFLFTGEEGSQYGYKDEWVSPEIFHYSGEGQRGDMGFARGNEAILTHMREGRDLHLFEYSRPRFVRYVGQMVCTGYHMADAPDIDGRNRKAIIFELTPIVALEGEGASSEGLSLDTPLESLRKKALEEAMPTASTSERLTVIRSRSQAVRLYARRRANGTCESCGEPAPFYTRGKEPYLEVHHLRRLSDGGPDHPDWVAAICPNCHRHAHHGGDAKPFNDRILRSIQREGS